MSVPPSQPAKPEPDLEVPPRVIIVHPPPIVLTPPPIVLPRFTPPEVDSDDDDMTDAPAFPKFDLPDNDGVPMETPWHRAEINLLIESVRSHFRERTDYYVGGNMFLYYGARQTKTWEYRGPDFFYVRNVDGTRPRRYWMVYEEGGYRPSVVIELTSSITVEEDHTTKKEIYETTLRVGNYFCYDPDSNLLEGWRLSYRYQPIVPDERGWLWCEILGLWLGPWEGEYQGTRAVWLRFFDCQGELVPTFLEAETARARELAAKLKTSEAEIARLQAMLEGKQIES